MILRKSYSGNYVPNFIGTARVITTKTFRLFLDILVWTWVRLISDCSQHFSKNYIVKKFATMIFGSPQFIDTAVPIRQETKREQTHSLIDTLNSAW